MDGGGDLGGGRGHEGRGGKWQPLGLRPQTLLLVQPHPGGKVWLLLFLRVCWWYWGGGRVEKGVNKMSPSVGRALP